MTLTGTLMVIDYWIVHTVGNNNNGQRPTHASTIYLQNCGSGNQDDAETKLYIHIKVQRGAYIHSSAQLIIYLSGICAES